MNDFWYILVVKISILCIIVFLTGLITLPLHCNFPPFWAIMYYSFVIGSLMIGVILINESDDNSNAR